ncbi:MAG: DUF5313 family protein [Mycobacteriaceae bacterium]
MPAARPGLLEYIAYCYGKVLPAEYDDWVRTDLAGKGARRRNLIRVTIPAVLVITPLWLIPATLGMHLAMSALLLLPCVYFAHALDKIWRAHRLRQHGLDPELVDEADRQRDAHLREDYRRRHGHSED